ncbi:NAD(+) diphosphatase [Nakamurella sp.]|uniref:NAD(+) diphosphatase n=1 Tax=Nakamurella sp. TaxID=1869182 RepID=UPI003784ACF7
MGVPTLSRGAADRSEDVRDPARIGRTWSTARVLVVDKVGRAEWDGTSLTFVPALSIAAEPPADAVLLGEIDGVDHWSVPGEVTGHRGGLREIGALLSDTDAGLFTTATALLTWHAAAPFCPRCGQRSTPRPAGWSRVCPNDHEDFPRTDPAVIVLVHDGDDSIVLARQPIWPPGRVSVLAGFVEAGESLEAAVVREIAEEVGLPVRDVQYLGSQPWPFPRSLMVGFAARADRTDELRPRVGEIESARWVDRATVRQLIAEDQDNWLSPAADGPDSSPGLSADERDNAAPVDAGTAFAQVLPGPVSIARRMIDAWAAAD